MKKEYPRIKPLTEIPADAVCVYKGRLWEVWEWDQVIYEGPSRKFQKVVRPDTAVAITITKEGKILITKEMQPDRTEPFTCAPRGLVDDGFSPKEQALKEINQETGYVAEQPPALVHERQVSPKIDWGVFIYIVRGCSKLSEQKLDGGEKITFHEITPMDFIKMGIAEQFDEHELNYYLMKLVLERGLEGAEKFLLYGK